MKPGDWVKFRLGSVETSWSFEKPKTNKGIVVYRIWAFGWWYRVSYQAHGGICSKLLHHNLIEPTLSDEEEEMLKEATKD